ncbi:RDD family protein [Halococcus agarilyticus]|uniref:RDD family protein n=1 Tax=Halococcus agarilyticus TaxID=1232219 RepID=UPI0006781F99|nr:RDD family protein [Halococcus agarilyticus]
MGSDDTDAGSGGSVERTKLHLASWDDRFVAWLIDLLLVGAVVSTFGGVGDLFTLATDAFFVSIPFLGANGVGFWLYWTALEGYRGQSAGKMVMDIAVTDERGGEIGYPAAAIESFGKAFVLPLDVLIGWLAMEEEYVRLFNRLSSTIVVDLPEGERVPTDVEYVPPKD